MQEQEQRRGVAAASFGAGSAGGDGGGNGGQRWVAEEARDVMGTVLRGTMVVG